MNSTLLSNEASVDLQVRLQFEFEAVLGRDLQVLLNHCYCRIENTRTVNPRRLGTLANRLTSLNRGGRPQ